MKISIQSLAAQAEFHQLPNKYKAFIGGYGTGKTQTMIDAAIMDSLASGSALIGLYAPTYDLLRLITIPRLRQKLDEFGIKYVYNQQRNTIITKPNSVGNFLFRSLDNPERIVGYETLHSHIDELDTLKAKHAEEAFNMVMARNRQNINGIENKIGVYSTPSGYQFCYKRWVEETTPEFGMVQASSLTNPFLPKGYVESMMANYPEALRNAYVNGMFCNLTSGSVYTAFDRTLNHCDSTLLDTDLEILVGMDFNISHTSAIIFVKRGNEYHIVDEIIDAFDTNEMVRIIGNRYSRAGRVIKIFPDAAGQQRHSTSGGLTDHIILRNAGFKVYVDGTNPGVRDRVNIVNAAFCNGNGIRRLKINTNVCRTTTKNISQQAYGKNGEPDKATGVDHTNDALGYAVCKLIPFVAPNVSTMMRFG